MRPLAFLFVAVLGFLTLSFAIGTQSVPLVAYAGIGIGIAIGGLLRSKEN